MYFTGRGVQFGYQDCAVAAMWWGKAAEQGIAAAQYNFGIMHRRRGCGVRETMRGREVVSKGCRSGSRRGAVRPRCQLRRRRGVPQDDAEAAKWYRKAADQGHANAQFNLGLYYDLGRVYRTTTSRRSSGIAKRPTKIMFARRTTSERCTATATAYRATKLSR